MASTLVAPARSKRLEDPLEYLPCSRTAAYKKSEIIYTHGEATKNLYLILAGKVKITRQAEDGTQSLVDIYHTDEFFGEAALLRPATRSEEAQTVEQTRLMMWTSEEVEDAVSKRPPLAVALLQVFSQRLSDFTSRIQSLSADGTDARLARSLVHFAGRFGTVEDDGGVRMMPFTHELLAQYVGTSREIITLYMNQFRRQGYVQYSRKSMLLYRDALREWLQRN